MAIQKNANLDISVAAEQNPNYNTKPSVQFSTQDRNTAKYTFTVKQNNKAVDLTDVTATVTLYTADKSVFQNNATVTNAKEGEIEYTIPPDAIRHHGSVKGELKLTYANGDALGGLRFSFNIEQSLIDKASGSTKEVYIEDFQTISNTVSKKAKEVTVNLERLEEEYQNKAYTVDEKLADVQATVTDLRENGTGIDAQARKEVEEVTTRLADIVHQAPVPNGVNDTQTLKTFFAKGYKNVQLKGIYRINLSEGDFIASFVNTDNIRIIGQDAKIIDLKTDYVDNGVITPLFKFEGCKNVNVDIDFEGQPLANPDTELGYKGMTVTYFTKECRNIKVKGNWKHCRYGVLSGNYIDENLGNCKNIALDLNTEFCGYPLASYLADDIKGSIVASDIHRAVYIAGTDGASLNIRFKNQYVADTACLITDAKTSKNSSKGCSNIHIKIVDIGSVVFMPGSMCAGITLSRVDPCEFKNIDLEIYVKSSDTIATTMGAFRIESNAKAFNGGIYPHNWENHVKLENIRVKGMIDRSIQTLPQGVARDVRIVTVDGNKYADVKSITFEDFVIIPPQVSYSNKETYFNVFNAKSINLNRFRTEELGVLLYTNTIDSTLNISNSKIGEVTANTGTISLSNSDIKSLKTGSEVVTKVSNSNYNGHSVAIKEKVIETSLSGANIVLTHAIPAYTILLSVTGIITESITGATGLQIGVPSELTRFLNANIVNEGTPITMGYQAATEVSPRFYATPTNLVITSRNGNFTGGKVKLIVSYIEILPPTK